MTRASRKLRSPEASAFYIAGILLLGIVVVAFIVSLFWTPYAPDATDASSKLLAPCADHPFGTDNFGRDVLSRVMAASKYTIFISAAGVAIALVLGTVSGIPAGYFGGFADRSIMLLGNSIMCFPGILLALVAVAVFGPSVANVIWALGLVFAPTFARVCRVGTMEIKELIKNGYDFVRENGSDIFGLGLEYYRNNPNINHTVQKNALLLEQIMQKFGFIGLEIEWWHFDYYKQYPVIKKDS